MVRPEAARLPLWGPGDQDRLAQVFLACTRVGDKIFEACWGEISQPFGTNHEEEPFEVGPVHRPDAAKWSQKDFSEKNASHAPSPRGEPVL